jgi:hypothetical protein
MSGQPPSAWAWLNWLPIRRRDQALLAECLSQALDAGLPVPEALAAAAEANASPPAAGGPAAVGGLTFAE